MIHVLCKIKAVIIFTEYSETDGWINRQTDCENENAEIRELKEEFRNLETYRRKERDEAVETCALK